LHRRIGSSDFGSAIRDSTQGSIASKLMAQAVGEKPRRENKKKVAYICRYYGTMTSSGETWRK